MREHIVNRGIYYLIFAILMALLALTIIVALFPLGPVGRLLAYSIAIAKAVLVIMFFMHVRYGPRLIWVTAGAAFLWLGILMVLTMSDYTTRGWTPGDESLHQPPSAIIPPPSRAPANK